jgi:hypothetical protein
MKTVDEILNPIPVVDSPLTLESLQAHIQELEIAISRLVNAFRRNGISLYED